jgi:trk system potassium uptake protein TrkA
MSQQGHTVTIIDRDPANFARLSLSFPGKALVGVGFDRDILDQAGIEKADALVAVGQSDEANIVVARLAKQIFGVKRVAARVEDPRKAEIFQQFGLMTVSPVLNDVERLRGMLGE